MKKLIVLLFVAGAIISGCNNHNGIGEMSQQDELALLQMEASLLGIISYNDSLVSYVDATGITNDSTCFYYDGQIHANDSLYSMHHNNYSHENGWDDHQCCGMMGSGMGNQGNMGQTNYMQHMNNEHGQTGMGHHEEDHEFMDSLMTEHEQYHPEN